MCGRSGLTHMHANTQKIIKYDNFYQGHIVIDMKEIRQDNSVMTYATDVIK